MLRRLGGRSSRGSEPGPASRKPRRLASTLRPQYISGRRQQNPLGFAPPELVPAVARAMSVEVADWRARPRARLTLTPAPATPGLCRQETCQWRFDSKKDRRKRYAPPLADYIRRPHARSASHRTCNRLHASRVELTLRTHAAKAALGPDQYTAGITS